MPTLARDFEGEPSERGSAHWANPNGGDAAGGIALAERRAIPAV
jgi:hypothetical protein